MKKMICRFSTVILLLSSVIYTSHCQPETVFVEILDPPKILSPETGASFPRSANVSWTQIYGADAYQI